MPSAPTTRSYSPDLPPLKVTRTWLSFWVKAMSETPNRCSTAAAPVSSASCSLARVVPKQGPTSLHSLPDTEFPQNPYAIRRQIDPCPNRWPRCAAFNELCGVALLVQGGRQGETRDAASNDQDPL